MTTTLRAATIAVLFPMAAGCAEDSLRLHARLALSCGVGETARPTVVGDGRIGVNTTFRAAPTAATMDENILSMYFYNAETEEMEIPGADILAARVGDR
ncbi:MAG: hypothetical protein F4X12_14545 [Acidobacteriia bacterium]|nr:hypothetical protein [Terriglobia bacterium]